MKKHVLYLHGFASSPDSQKVQLIRERLGEQVEFTAPDLNVPSFEKLSFASMVETALAAARRVHPAAILGSSLGSLVALAVAKNGFPVPLILLAPALGVVDHWEGELPPGDPLQMFHYATETERSIHRQFFEEMKSVDVDREPPPSRVSIIMGRNDESVPLERVEEIWKSWQDSGKLANGSRLIEIPEGDHRLIAHIDIVTDEVRSALKL